MQSKQALKSRIKSIKSTRKITGAMELIANAKLTKQRNTMQNTREYQEVLEEVIKDIIASDKELNSPYLKEPKSDKVLTVIFTSDLGLCGAYNINVFKLALSRLKKEDPVLLIGTKMYSAFKNEGFNIINEMTGIDATSYEDLSKMALKAIEMYLHDEVGKINVLYTRFVNTMTFEASLKTLLPYEKCEGSTSEIIFDPSAGEVLDGLIEMVTLNSVYTLSLEAKTSEQASRRLAMENANDNAEELEDELILAYNQARQAAITQEITEIVSGADAL